MSLVDYIGLKVKKFSDHLTSFSLVICVYVAIGQKKINSRYIIRSAKAEND